jgi:dihydropteroate synthase
MLGILNLTPDSFSDGGDFLDESGALRSEELLAAAQQLAEEGAELLDLGAESTRPDSTTVSDAVQLQRLLPAIAALRAQSRPLSIDTRSAAVAEACLQAGASWINDVSGLGDPQMAPLLARSGAPVFLMHLRGTPADMNERAHYRHLLGEVADELAARVSAALAAGVAASQIVLDPGIGFAKNAEQSAELVRHCGALRALGLPLLIGPSRKSYLATAVGGDAPARASNRDAATVDAAAQCGTQGAAWLRLHRGGAALEAARTAHHRAFGLEIPA